MNDIDKHTGFFFYKYRDALICLFLIILTLVVYWQVAEHDFINFDDTIYITENRYVQSGLTFESVTWAFTTPYSGNWHPLTWLSHMLDCQLFGLNPGWHHLTNLFFHIANTLLLFIVFRSISGNSWQSGFVAALFAFHPLHVESVAWIAERKDVLSTFFWMLTMMSYFWYIKQPGKKRCLLVFLFFALGLMAKPMLVTLPFVFLLLDYWPLKRFQTNLSTNGKDFGQRSINLWLVWEKIPLFVLSVASSALTYLVQNKRGAVESFDVIPISARIANALVSYVNYLWKMIWPAKMAIFYPHTGMLQWWKVIGAVLLLLFISVLAIKLFRDAPYFVVGWLWYIGTLVPVIGLVQVGSQSMADRYTYIPLIGLFTVISWGVPDLLAGWAKSKVWLSALATLLILILMAVAWRQVGYWKNSITLFEHALEVTSNNYISHNNLGAALEKQGQVDEAIKHYLKVLHIRPNYVKAHSNLGNALTNQGRIDEAMIHCLEALRIKPDSVLAHNNLGNILVKQGRVDEAIKHYLEALRIKPDYPVTHYNIGVVYANQGRIDEAIGHYQEALQIKADFVEAHKNLGDILAKQDRIDEAIYHYQETLRIIPGDDKAQNNLGVALAKQGRIDEAIDHYQEALRIQPDYETAHYNLGNALVKQGRIDEAIGHYQEALRIKPDFVEARQNIEDALKKEASYR